MGYMWDARYDPDEVKDYTVDWTDLLDSDTISTSAWTIPAAATGLTKDSDTNTTTATTIWLSVTDPATNRAALVGKSFWLVNKITTAGSRTYERQIKLRIVEL
jgi:hypothetical protein